MTDLLPGQPAANMTLCPDCRDCFADCVRCGGVGWLPPQIRVLITGSREFTDRSIIAKALSQVRREHRGSVLHVVAGAAKGADSLAAAVVRDADPSKAVLEEHPVTDAMWRPDGPNGPVNKRAGIERNQRMVDLGADVCLAFLRAGAGNRGTKHCIGAAKRAGIEVREFEQGPF
ncbi:SLOG family protein [Curtobacterium sp. MCBD17_040]|uniref:SLOG family protein n=1 Tax=Curtobacterium sp. MCBD17_040 TaxID=2175674 RepID=UPI000DA794E4|nr:SLOG family protein [Curtobacterium sp. MCBD17_040]WIB65360.1 SLOG family protein [Curtobacterium sp. MCBD17_040]